MAIEASRPYHSLAADLKCSYLSHNSEEVSLLLSKRLEKAFRDREDARAELLLHESNHAGGKITEREPLSDSPETA
jgi:hypothetical protein